MIKRIPLKFPGFWQGVVVCLVFVGVQLVVFAPAGISDAIAKTKFLTNPWLYAVVNSVAAALAIFTGMKMGRVPLKTISPLRELTIPGVLAVTATTLGVAILLHEIHTMLSMVIPLSAQQKEFIRELFMGSHGWVPVALLLVVVAPITEELLLRGLILRGFLSRYRASIAILASAFLFGVIHMNVHQFFTGLILGCVYGWWYKRSGSLTAGLLGHALNNTLIVVAMWTQFKIPGVIDYSIDAPPVHLPPLVLAGAAALTGAGLWMFFCGTNHAKPEENEEIEATEQPPPLPPIEQAAPAEPQVPSQ